MEARTVALSWASKAEASMVGARRASALFETGVLEMRIDWWVLEGGVVPCTVLLEFLGGEKRQCKDDTAPAGVGDSNVGAK